MAASSSSSCSRTGRLFLDQLVIGSVKPSVKRTILETFIGSNNNLPSIQKIRVKNLRPNLIVGSMSVKRTRQNFLERGYYSTGRFDPLPNNNRKNRAGIDLTLAKKIYLNFNKDVDYYHCKNKSIEIRTHVNQAQENMSNSYTKRPKIRGIVNQEQFDIALECYENNQMYYLELFDKNLINEKQLSARLTRLEKWFLQIIEPKPKKRSKYYKDDFELWQEREYGKLDNKLSGYCLPELKKYIAEIQKEIFIYIKNCHKK